MLSAARRAASRVLTVPRRWTSATWDETSSASLARYFSSCVLFSLYVLPRSTTSWGLPPTESAMKSVSLFQTLARSGEQRFDEGVRIERPQVLDAFSDPDVAHRQLHLVADSDDDPALRRTVELGEHDSGDADARVELF